LAANLLLNLTTTTKVCHFFDYGDIVA